MEYLILINEFLILKNTMIFNIKKLLFFNIKYCHTEGFKTALRPHAFEKKNPRPPPNEYSWIRP